MERAEIERRVRELKWAAPSGDLRTRVLETSVPATPRVTWSDRVWFSRTWRIAAAVAVVGAIGVDALWGTSAVERVTPSRRAVAEAEAIGETGREIGLPVEMAAALARRAIAGNSRSRPGDSPLAFAVDGVDAQGERR